MRKQTSAMILVLVAAAVTAYASPAAYADHPTATVSNAPGSSTPGCEVENECFIPADVTVDVGGEVTWTNDDSAAHTITSGSPDTGGPDGVFDSSLVMPDTEFKWTFDEAGEYPYFCVVHPWMRGMVTVASDHSDEMDDAMMDDMMMDDMMMAEKPDGAASATGMLDDGTVVEIMAEKDLQRRVMEITVTFNDAEHVNYDIMAVQAGETVLDVKDAHSHGGVETHTTMPLQLDPDNDPLDITVSFKGYGISEPYEGTPSDVEFASIVPEFGTIAAMILAVAIVSIIAVTARSRLSLAPRI